MAEFDPERKYDDHSFENPVYDDQVATVYDPSEAWKYQDEANLQHEAQSVKMAVDDFYKYFEENGLKTGSIDYNYFKLVNSKLRVKGSLIDLINKSTGKPLALTSIRSQQGRSVLLRKIGLYEYSKLSQKTVAALAQSSGEINNLSARAEAVEMSELPSVVQQVDDNVTLMLRGIDGSIDGSEFTLRELRGLDNTMQTYREELGNNLGKLKTLDENIAAEEAKLNNLQLDDEHRLAIENQLKSLLDERRARLEAASASSTALKSQICRIKETISRILAGDTTLAQLIKTLFREQGVTIFSILTALGLAISTLILALTGGGGGGRGGTAKTREPATPEPAPPELAPSNKGM